MRLGEDKKSPVSHQVGWWLSLLLAVPAIVQAERLSTEVYTTAGDWAHNAANRIVRNSPGFLWIGTRDGLSRCDGYRFTTSSGASCHLATLPGEGQGAR